MSVQTEDLAKDAVNRLPYFLRPLGVFITVNFGVAFVISAFCFVAFRHESHEIALRVISFVLLLAFILSIFDFVLCVVWIFAPYRRVYAALLNKIPLNMLAKSDVRRTLQLPQWLFVLGSFRWVLTTSLWLGFVYDAPWLHFKMRLLTSIASMCFGHIAATFTFYLLLHFTQIRVAPILLRAGHLGQVGPFRAVRVYHHVVLLIVTLGVVQPLLAWALLSGHWVDLDAAVGFVAVLILGVSIVQGIGMLAQLSRPAGQLDEAMLKVAAGNLDAQAAILNLDTFGRLASQFNVMVEGLRQRERIRETFGRYVTQQVADEILAGELKLGGELRTATVLFSDIRGFTRMSENMPPEEVVEFLNEYLDLMVDCVIDAGGTLDKFIGDAVMAVFGVPVSTGEKLDVLSGLQCALQMTKRLFAFNEARVLAGKPSIEIGIGLHTGPLVAGNIGSKKRMEYTVIGDTVNLCSRLEGLTKEFGEGILVSGEVIAQLDLEKHSEFVVDKIKDISVRGREEKVAVYSVNAA